MRGPFTGVLQLGGETLELQRPDEPGLDKDGNPFVPYVTVDAVRYNGKAPWPLEPNGNGPSLARIDAQVYGNDPINSHASPINGGTPGTTESFLPARPTNLTATAVSGHDIHLVWTDASQNEGGSRVERSADGVGGWTELIALGANVTTHQAGGLAFLTAYYYRVVAYNGYGSSGYSNVASATTLNEPPPADPSNLDATTVSDTKIGLTWVDNATNETGYNVYWSPNGTTDWFLLARDLPPTAASNVIGFSAMPLFSTTTRSRYTPLPMRTTSPVSTASAARPIVLNGFSDVPGLSSDARASLPCMTISAAPLAQHRRSMTTTCRRMRSVTRRNRPLCILVGFGLKGTLRP